MKFYLDYERINHHKSMLSDTIRTLTFKKAIMKLVFPGSVVADVGSGSGILSLFASKSGAKKVYAIERTGIIEVAKKVAQSNGLNNIVFINKDATKVKLKNKCDVIISECIGYFALQENMLSDFISFCRKNLKKDGVMIPSQVDLFLFLVGSPASYEEVNFWNNELYGFDFSHLRLVAANSAYHISFQKKDLMSKTVKIKTYDLMNDNHMDLNVECHIRPIREGKVYGLGGYFIAKLAPGIELTNSPEKDKTHWKCEFFPLLHPINVKRGQVLKVKIKAELHKAFVDWEWGVKTKEKYLKQSTKIGIRLKEGISG